MNCSNFFNTHGLQTFLLNGKVYNTSEVPELCNKKLCNTATEPWEKDIFSFISELFSQSNYIYVATSGTTGNKKHVKLYKQGLIASAKRTEAFFGYRPGNKALLCVPAEFIAGKMMIVRALISGLDLWYTKPVAMPFTNRQAFDFVALTPYQLQHSLPFLKQGVKNVLVGGAPVSPQLAEQLQALPCRVYESFGMTETYTHIALKPLNGKHADAWFRVLPGILVRTNKQLCLIIESTTDAPFKVETNDVVALRQNKFKWLGRSDNMINSGGINVFPEQLEKKLANLITDEFFVTSKSDQQFGQVVVLMIESETYPPEKLKTLKEKLKTVLNHYEVPKDILFLPAFKYTTTGKIQRKASARQAGLSIYD